MPDRAAVALMRCTEAVYSFSAAVAFSSTVAVSTRANVRFNDDEENANHEVDDFEGDVEFDLDSHAGCRACGHSGALRFFKSA